MLENIDYGEVVESFAVEEKPDSRPVIRRSHGSKSVSRSGGEPTSRMLGTVSSFRAASAVPTERDLIFTCRGGIGDPK